MSRFKVLQAHRIIGTEEEVFLRAMSATSTASTRKSVLAALLPKGEEEPDPERAASSQASAILLHTFDNADGTDQTFRTAEQVREDLSELQAGELFTALMELGGFSEEAVAVARRFPDGGGEAGGTPTAPDGEGVRTEAEPAPE